MLSYQPVVCDNCQSGCQCGTVCKPPFADAIFSNISFKIDRQCTLWLDAGVCRGEALVNRGQGGPRNRLIRTRPLHLCGLDLVAS